jgi:anti-sigma factor RsiW
MNATLDDRVEAYLDGTLSPEDAAAFERELATPGNAEAFRRSLAIRTLLAAAPVPQAPDGLEERVIASLGLGRRPGTARTAAGAALQGLRWTIRGPALAWSAGGGGHGALSGLRAGAGSLGWAWSFGRRAGA